MAKAPVQRPLEPGGMGGYPVTIFNTRDREEPVFSLLKYSDIPTPAHGHVPKLKVKFPSRVSSLNEIR